MIQKDLVLLGYPYKELWVWCPFLSIKKGLSYDEPLLGYRNFWVWCPFLSIPISLQHRKRNAYINEFHLLFKYLLNSISFLPIFTKNFPILFFYTVINHFYFPAFSFLSARRFLFSFSNIAFPAAIAFHFLQ